MKSPEQQNSEVRPDIKRKRHGRKEELDLDTVVFSEAFEEYHQSNIGDIASSFERLYGLEVDGAQEKEENELNRLRAHILNTLSRDLFVLDNSLETDLSAEQIIEHTLSGGNKFTQPILNNIDSDEKRNFMREYIAREDIQRGVASTLSSMKRSVYRHEKEWDDAGEEVDLNNTMTLAFNDALDADADSKVDYLVFRKRPPSDEAGEYVLELVQAKRSERGHEEEEDILHSHVDTVRTLRQQPHFFESLDDEHVREDISTIVGDLIDQIIDSDLHERLRKYPERADEIADDALARTVGWISVPGYSDITSADEIETVDLSEAERYIYLLAFLQKEAKERPTAVRNMISGVVGETIEFYDAQLEDEEQQTLVDVVELAFKHLPADRLIKERQYDVYSVTDVTHSGAKREPTELDSELFAAYYIDRTELDTHLQESLETEITHREEYA